MNKQKVKGNQQPKLQNNQKPGPNNSKKPIDKTATADILTNNPPITQMSKSNSPLLQQAVHNNLGQALFIPTNASESEEPTRVFEVGNLSVEQSSNFVLDEVDETITSQDINPPELVYSSINTTPPIEAEFFPMPQINSASNTVPQQRSFPFFPSNTNTQYHFQQGGFNQQPFFPTYHHHDHQNPPYVYSVSTPDGFPQFSQTMTSPQVPIFVSTVQQPTVRPPVGEITIKLPATMDLTKRDVQVGPCSDGNWVITKYENIVGDRIKTNKKTQGEYAVSLKIVQSTEGDDLGRFHVFETSDNFVFLNKPNQKKGRAQSAIDLSQSMNYGQALNSRMSFTSPQNPQVLLQTQPAQNSTKPAMKSVKQQAQTQSSLCQKIASCLCCCGFFTLSRGAQLAMFVLLIAIVGGLYYASSNNYLPFDFRDAGEVKFI